MTFGEFALDPRLQAGIRKSGFLRPTPIQQATVPEALTGRDIMGSAETGTGKTAAYLLPLLQRLLTAPAGGRKVRALILVPTRELALQVAAQAKQLGAGTDLRSTAIYGGVGLGNQETVLRRGVDVVIATPGRLIDHMTRRNINFAALEVLVLDEADRMLDVGFLPDLRRIMQTLPRERQTMLFSATMPSEVLQLAKEVTRNAARIQVEKTTAPTVIQQTLFPVPEHLKAELLKTLLNDEQMSSVLVFARTKHRADRVVKQLRNANIDASVIHGDRSQGQRIAALESFRRGHSRVLVATDIAARGIDVEGVTHVVNYDVPMQSEDYVHRIGRTGRAEATGNAYTLVTPPDEDMIRRIEYLLKEKIQRRRIEGMDYRAAAVSQPSMRSERSARPARPVRRFTAPNRRSQRSFGRRQTA